MLRIPEVFQATIPLQNNYKSQEKFLRWDILGINEQKRKENKERIFHSGHISYYVEEENKNKLNKNILV